MNTDLYSPEAEQSVLGAILLSQTCLDIVQEVLVGDDFYAQKHRTIYTAMQSLEKQQDNIDALTVSEGLEKSGQLEEIGGISYIASLAENTGSISHVREYAEIVHKRAVLRGLMRVTTEIQTLIQKPDGRTTEEILEIAQRDIEALSASHDDREALPIGDSVGGTLDRIDELFRSQTGMLGLSTGFTDLDSRTCGLENGNLILLAGRPSMGKTALAMNIAENVAMDGNKRVLIFSMEMSTQQLVMRVLASRGRVNFYALRSGRNMTDDDWGRLTDAAGKIQKTTILVDQSPALSPAQVRGRARRVAKSGLDLIIIDYLQLMQCRAESKRLEVEEISRQMKQLARELNVPVILLSQLNRGVEQRTNKRPMMADLRESGALEQDADIIMFIYRDEIYNENSEYKGIAEIIFAKQRNGEPGTERLTFQGRFVRFDNYSRYAV